MKTSFISARVMAANGEPQSRASVDVRQTDSEGFYDVQDTELSNENISLRAASSSLIRERYRFARSNPRTTRSQLMERRAGCSRRCTVTQCARRTYISRCKSPA